MISITLFYFIKDSNTFRKLFTSIFNRTFPVQLSISLHDQELSYAHPFNWLIEYHNIHIIGIFIPGIEYHIAGVRYIQWTILLHNHCRILTKSRLNLWHIYQFRL